MRKLHAGGVSFVLVAAAVLALGCSSDSGSDKSNATVDPAVEDFCLHWANSVCRLAYLCTTDPSQQDAAFHARYGASQDDCWQSVEKYCTSNQTGSAAFGPSCGPGKQVNAAAATACTDGIDSSSCTDWKAQPGGDCAAVCGVASNPGAGGAPGAGGSGAAGAGTAGASSGGSGTGSLATAREFCDAEQSALCDRIFECKPESGAATFGTLSGCKAAAASDCETTTHCVNGYAAASGSSCVTAIQTLSCADLMTEPDSCAAACQE